MGKRKRRWIIACAGACVLIAAAVAINAAKPNRYAFLDRFHPRRAESSQVRAAFGEEQIMLIFPDADTTDVFRALQHELTESAGFMAYPDKGVPVRWTFVRRESVSAGKAREVVRFLSGSDVAGIEQISEHPNQRPEVPLTPCCLVLLPRRKLTWIEVQWTNLRSFLHL